MMAKRFPRRRRENSKYHGEACEEAAENVVASPFADRVGRECCRLQDFHSEESFHVIVEILLSSNSLKIHRKPTMARHNDSLPFRDLLGVQKCC